MEEEEEMKIDIEEQLDRWFANNWSGHSSYKSINGGKVCLIKILNKLEAEVVLWWWYLVVGYLYSHVHHGGGVVCPMGNLVPGVLFE